MRRYILYILLVLVEACAVHQPPNLYHGFGESYEIAPNDTLITFIQRLSCRGGCPAYDLVVYGDGQVVFNGKRHVKVERRAEAYLAWSDVSALIDAFDRASYFSLHNDYRCGSPECRCSGTAAASTSTISLRLSYSKRKVVVRDHRCKGFPGRSRLLELEKTIADLARAKQWL